LLRSLALSLINKGKIKTTEAKAKEIRPFVEKLITTAIPGTLSAKRILLSRLFNRLPETKKLLEVIAPKYKERKGGYTRIIKVTSRRSDAAKMAIIEFI